MKISKIKTSTCIIFLAASILGFSSCKNHEDHSTEKTELDAKAEDITRKESDLKYKESNEYKDSEKAENTKFLVSASEINLEEISLGKLVQQRSTHSDVKALAKMMVTAHTKAQADLVVLAAKKDISIPTENTADIKETYKKLDAIKNQKEFDKTYVDMMVDGHKKAIDLFETKSVESSDADIRAWATSMLPGLREHLEHAKAVQEKCAKM